MMMMMMMTRRVVRGSGIQGRTLPRLEDIALWGVIVFFLSPLFYFSAPDTSQYSGQAGDDDENEEK